MVKLKKQVSAIDKHWVKLWLGFNTMTPFALEHGTNKSEDSFGTALLKCHHLKTEKNILQYSVIIQNSASGLFYFGIKCLDS